MQQIILGIFMGIMGSMHCIGMCGPLVLSIHARGGYGKSRVDYQVLYHLGKIIAYVLIGVVFGSLGKSFHLFLSQQKLSLLVGNSFLFYFIFNKFKSINLTSIFSKKLLNSTRWFSNLIKDRNYTKLLLTGLGNGFLPCGLVYTAGLASVSTGHIVSSVLFMLGFGVGTIPSLTIVIYLSKLIPTKFKLTMNYLYKYMLLIVAIILIVRGLNLGIPYVSPSFEEDGVPICCHKK